MIYGKLFKKFQAANPGFDNLSANRCSLLTYKELKSMAKILYVGHSKTIGSDYMRTNKENLALRVFNALREL